MYNRDSDPMGRYIRKIDKKEKQRRTAILAIFCVTITVIASSAGFCLGRITSKEHQGTERSVVDTVSFETYKYTPETNKNGLDKAQQEARDRIVANRLKEAAANRAKEDIRNINIVYKDYSGMIEQIGLGKESPKCDYPEQDKPHCGEVIYYNTSYSNYEYSEMTVSPPGSKDLLVELRDTISGGAIMKIYVCAGDTITVRVPAVQANVVFWCGEKWYGADHYFSGESGDMMVKCDENIADFQNGNIKYVISYIDNGK